MEEMKLFLLILKLSKLCKETFSSSSRCFGSLNLYLISVPSFIQLVGFLFSASANFSYRAEAENVGFGPAMAFSKWNMRHVYVHDYDYLKKAMFMSESKQTK